ncbi:penicillin acylase family protein [Gaopeijia maritima]|uniref:penicillin acylase family protein n=1 Tax=Gaopeijia maritima TaxID=3119007 RepID=UPI003254D535
MKKSALALAFVAMACAPEDAATPAGGDDVAAWEAQAARVTITRDDWGIPHIYGPTDADAVFGLVYAQAEDDYERVERNYLFALGRLAQKHGEEELWADLRMRLFVNDDDLRERYASSPEWLRAVMDGWAAGLNYYLHTHPSDDRTIERWEPWMALSFTEGSIGGDIERISTRGLETFYGAASPATAVVGDAGTANEPLSANVIPEPTGSNGIAIAPENTVDGNALLLINPHTSHYFRAEVQVTSDEGLNAYGAVTWGQPFVYQGFNETAGWMHTSTGADAIDEFAYEVVERDDGVYYAYGDEERQLEERTITVPYLDGGSMAERTFTVYYSHEGPIVRSDGGDWVAVKLMFEPVDALIQSYSRTKAANYDEFREVMDLHTNSSNNTIFADAEGNIAYFHANHVPIRDASLDWTRPVDGNDPGTAYRGLHSVEESPLVVNPASGWVMCTNNWPYSAAGVDDPSTPREADYPDYMDRYGENARGVHAIAVLEGRTDFTLDGLVDAAYDSWLPVFAESIPPLIAAYDADPAAAEAAAVSEQIAVLRDWDHRFGVESVATSLAIYWATELRSPGDASGSEQLAALAAASQTLADDFGDWRTPWGEINRFQRLTADIVPSFDDDAPSLPVAFTSATWGSLAAHGQRVASDTRRIYGTRGNSFVAVVEFGDRVRARAITAGGQSGDPNSPHFDDQAERFAAGDLRTVYFYPEDVEAAAEETYRPGER